MAWTLKKKAHKLLGCLQTRASAPTQSSKQIFQQAEALLPLPGEHSHHADGPSIEWNTSSTTALEQYVQLHEQGKQEHLCQASAFPSHQPSENSHSGP